MREEEMVKERKEGGKRMREGEMVKERKEGGRG